MLNLCAIFLVMGVAMGQTMSFNLSQTNKYGNTNIFNTLCNQQTQIDLFFSSKSSLSCNVGECSTSSAGASYMKFMDINGIDLLLTLNNAYALSNTAFIVNDWNVTPNYYFAFHFGTSGNERQVLVLSPMVTANPNSQSQIYDVSKINDGTMNAFQNLGSTISLNAFNYMNQIDYSRFYHVTNAEKTFTILLSNTVLQSTTSFSNPLAALPGTIPTITPDYAASGNKLCYASNETSGVFQQHLRESWPLWTCLLSIFFYWVVYLFADSEKHEIYDVKYEENKWTCWSLYSLKNLAHIQFFSFLSRWSLVLFNYSFQGMVLAAIYSTLGQNTDPYTHYEIIIWSAAIAFGASLPIPYILGGIFLRKIYNTTLQKFKIIIKSRGVLNKKQQQAIYEAQVDKLEETSYSFYYWYYILIFAGFVCFWIPAIYMMMQTKREWFYLHRIWLASLGIVVVLDHFIFDPILSYFLGNTKFYRIRGYFYNYDLGKQYKQIQE